MIRVFKTFTRQSVRNLWWHETTRGAEHLAYRTATYGSKLSEPTSESSPDGLTWRYSINWSSQEDWNTMMADPIIIAGLDARNTYYSQSGSTQTPPEIRNI
jgi:hypothetical protein